MTVNSRLIYTYWRIVQHILEKQTKQGWGSKVIDQLALDLSVENTGFSKRNLIYMRQFANELPEHIITQHVAA